MTEGIRPERSNLARIRFELDESSGPVPERGGEVEWPSVPRVGDYVDIDATSGESRLVKSVTWRTDGTVVVRLGS